MEHHATYRARVVQAEVGPVVAGVGRAIDTAAPRGTLPVVVLACAGPDDLRVSREDRERTERVVGLVAEDILPRDAVVRALPDAPARRAHIEDRGISRIDLQVVDAAAGCGGADRTKVQGGERRRGGPGLRARGGYCAACGAEG